MTPNEMIAHEHGILAEQPRKMPCLGGIQRRYLNGLRSVLCIAAALPLALSTTGCGGGSVGSQTEGVDGSLAETGRALFEAAEAADAVDYDWSIVIATFNGPRHAEFAALGAEKVRTETDLRDIRVQRRGEQQSAVVLGRYTTPADPRAQRDLKRVRETEVDGGTPFAGAFVGPPPPPRPDQLGAYDLRRVALAQPNAAYSLQIGIYRLTDQSAAPTPEERRELHRAAEAAVRDLRAEGVEAFYQHGPGGSNVAVGLFTEEEHRLTPGRPPIESDRLKRMRERFPHLLLNGQGQRRIVRTPTGQAVERPLEPSVLVRVPR